MLCVVGGWFVMSTPTHKSARACVLSLYKLYANLFFVLLRAEVVCGVHRRVAPGAVGVALLSLVLRVGFRWLHRVRIWLVFTTDYTAPRIYSCQFSANSNQSCLPAPHFVYIIPPSPPDDDDDGRQHWKHCMHDGGTHMRWPPVKISNDYRR